MSKEVAEMRPYELAVKEMAGRAEMEASDGSAFDIASQVADKILTADSIEAVIGAVGDGPDGLENIQGKPFFFTGLIRYAKSSEQYREGGVGVYVVFDIVDMQGEKHTVTTGAVNVVFQLRQMEKLGYFGDTDWISDRMFTVRSRITGTGNTLYRVDLA